MILTRPTVLFHELVPDAGEGVQFTPPFNVDYGIGLTIGRGTFLNKDFHGVRRRIM